MIDRVVCIGGPPGSGKSTAGRLVAKQRKLEYLSAGDRFREEARRRGMDLAEFSSYAEQHPEVDRSLDDVMLEAASPGRLIDARLTGALLRRSGTPAFLVVVDAPMPVRVRRLAERDHLPIARAEESLRSREASEEMRYRRLYGVDVRTVPFDFRVDSGDLPAPEVARAILDFLGSRSHA